METSEEKRTLVESFVASLYFILSIFGSLFALYYFNFIVFCSLKLWTIIFLIVLVIGPLIFRWTDFIQRGAIFVNFVNLPRNPNFSNPSKYGIDGVFNFYLTTNDNIKLGVWHILPNSIKNCADPKDETYCSQILGNGQDVLIYNHGNSGNRIASHRIELYQVLRKHFHVIAFDYRGYGDSSNVKPSELGAVNDSKFMYKWVQSKTKANIFVWGHSLGTGISSHALAQLSSENICPAGLILESPFTNLREEIFEHPLSRPFRTVPWFTYTVLDSLSDNGIKFETNKHITKINCPILILHAKDDMVVPHKLGKRLYEIAQEKRTSNQGRVNFHEFSSKLKLGHKYICRSPAISEIISEFVSNCVQSKKSAN